MKKLRILIPFLSILIPSLSYAQNCDTALKSQEWREDIMTIRSALDSQEWDYALSKSYDLYSQCKDSPILNFYIARALGGKGDKIKSLQFYQAAADLLSQISAAPEDSRRIWYSRYEAERPERTDQAMLETKAQVERLEAELDTSNKALEAYKKNAKDQYKRQASIGMWTGTGVGIAGIIMTAVGGYLAFNSGDHFESKGFGEIQFKDGTPLDSTVNIGDLQGQLTSTETYSAKASYIAGLTLFGAGMAFTLAGAITAGIYGYRYTHVDLDDATLSFGLTPQSFSMNMSF